MYHRFVAARLAKAGINTIGDLLKTDKEELMKIYGIGSKCLGHIRTFLVAYGYEDKARDLGADHIEIQFIKSVCEREYPLTVEQYQKLGRYDDILEQ